VGSGGATATVTVVEPTLTLAASSALVAANKYVTLSGTYKTAGNALEAPAPVTVFTQWPQVMAGTVNSRLVIVGLSEVMRLNNAPTVDLDTVVGSTVAW